MSYSLLSSYRLDRNHIEFVLIVYLCMCMCILEIKPRAKVNTSLPILVETRVCNPLLS